MSDDDSTRPWPLPGNPDEQVGARHHYVPRFYLQRFANAKGQIARIKRATGERAVVNVKDVAAERDFYTYEDSDGNFSGRMEQMLGHVEGRARDAMQKISNPLFGQAFPPSLEVRADIVTFLAFQLVRGRSFRRRGEQLFDLLARVRLDGISDRGLLRLARDAGEELSESELAAIRSITDRIDHFSFTPDSNQHIGTMGPTALKLGEVLWDWPWYIYDFTEPALLTSDEPVALSFSSERGHSGGISNADEVYFALNPRTLLALRNPDRAVGEYRNVWPPSAAAHPNQVIAQNSYEYIFQHPDMNFFDQLAPLEELPLFRLESGGRYDSRYNRPLMNRRTQRRRRNSD